MYRQPHPSIPQWHNGPRDRVFVDDPSKIDINPAPPAPPGTNSAPSLWAPTAYDGIYADSSQVLPQDQTQSQFQATRFFQFRNAAGVAQEGFGRGSIDHNASAGSAYLNVEQQHALAQQHYWSYLSQDPSASGQYHAGPVPNAAQAAGHSDYERQRNTITTTATPSQLISPPYTVTSLPSPGASEHSATHATTASVPTIPLAKLIPCRLNHGRCTHFFSIYPNDKRGLIEHLNTFHDGAKSKVQLDCSWVGCVCSPQSRRKGRCGMRPKGHGAHGEDLGEHIWNTHLGFLYTCNVCGRAEWTTSFARNRHRDGLYKKGDLVTPPCGGVISARCPTCLGEFNSNIALERHLVDRKCPKDTSA